jgi:hypothetical protein
MARAEIQGSPTVHRRTSSSADWLDEEIASLCESVAADVDGKAASVRPARFRRWRRFVLRRARRSARVADPAVRVAPERPIESVHEPRDRSTLRPRAIWRAPAFVRWSLFACALAVTVGALIGWLFAALGGRS